MTNLSAVIGSTSVTVMAISENNTMDGRSVTTLTLYDAAGTQDFPERTQVTVNDTLNNYFFSGFVTSDQKTPMPNGVALTHAVSCVDETDIPVRHYYSGPEWANRYAGDIVTDLVAGPLSADGITASYAIDEDKALSDFQQGTQSNTAAVATATGGALQLASAGSIVTKTESTAANWNAGTLTGAMTNGNLLQLNAHPALSFSGVCSSGYGNAYAYYKIWSGSYVIQSGDKLRYKMWINSGSPQIMAGIDAICTDGTSLRDFNSSGGGATGPFAGFTFDQNGLRCHPGTDLSGFANDQWYERKITFLSGMNGKTISYVDIAFEGDSAGTYQAYFYDIWIENSGGTITQNLFGNSGVISPLISFPNLSAKVSNIGYSNIQINSITAYEATGTRISGNNSIQNAGIYQSSLLSWQATTPDGTALVVYTSVDGGATYQPATNQAAITNIPLGALLTSRNITTKIVMSISGKDPTATPQVSTITWTVSPAYAATQTATRTKFDTQADWNSGTLSETLATSGGDLTINGVTHNWKDGSVANQTAFGNSNPFQSTIKYAGSLRTDTSSANDARSRFDFAGTWQDNFTFSVDVSVPAANTTVGINYRTTGWQNNNNTYGWSIDLGPSDLNLGYGTNSGSGTGTRTTPTGGDFGISPALTVGDWHTITVSVSGSTHLIYLDGVNVISVTDTHYNTVNGNIGARVYNNSGGGQTVYFNNFGIMPTDGVYPGPGAFSGPTWTSPSISLGSFTAGNNLIFWDASTIAGDYLNVQTSFNGGAYTNATNNAPIPGITIGTAYVSATLQVKVQMQAATAADTPVLHGLTTWVTSQYSSSGNRISVPLSLAPVGKAGATGATWTALQPANTTVAIDTSTDSINWTLAGSGITGQAAVAGIFSQSDPVVDQFTSNTSANYTSTFRTGGAIASWVWDIANKRLTVSGGTNAQLIYNSPLTGVDVDVSAVLDQSDNGGFVWRWVDQSNHYSLIIHDASSGNNPNTAQLFVVSGGTATQIGANAAISFTRGTPHAYRVSMIGTSILILMDGVVLFNTGDATINQAGFAGFRTDSTGGSSARFYLFRLQYYGQDVSTATIFSRVRLTSTDPTVTPQVNALSMSVHDPAIQNGALIPQTNYSVLNNNRMTIAQICDDLIKQSGFTTSSTNFWWKVISNRMNFQQHQATPAPWVLTPQGATNCDIVDSPAPMIDNANSTYRNSQWGTGGMDVVAQSRSFVGNGTQTTFDCGFPIDSVTSITLNGATQTFGLSNVSTGLNWYYTQGQSTVVQDTSGTPLIGSQTLTVAFNAQVSITANVQNPTEIARIANIDNTTGVIDEGEDMSGLNKQAMIAKCSGLVNQFGQKNQTLTFTTNRAGLAVGQLLPVFASPLGVFAGAFLLIQVKIGWRVVGTGGGAIMQSPRFECQAVAGPQVLGWLRYLSRLGVQ